MRVKLNATLKCNDIMITAGEILNDKIAEFPEFIKELVESKSDLVMVIPDLPEVVVSVVDPELDKIIDDKDDAGDAGDDEKTDDSTTDDAGDGGKTDDSTTDDTGKLKRRGK